MGLEDIVNRWRQSPLKPSSVDAPGNFDESRLNRTSIQLPFSVPADLEGVPVSKAHLQPFAEVLIFQCGDQRRGLIEEEIGYHHVAQGFSLDGEPYVVAYCNVCQSGTVLNPQINNRVLRIQCGGLYNGTIILKDQDTGTFWDHMTGKALYGPLAGEQMQVRPIQMSTVAELLRDEPDLKILRSNKTGGVLYKFSTKVMLATGFMPPIFSDTLGQEDTRFPRMTLGLGVIVGKEAKFYPKEMVAEPLSDKVGSTKVEIDVLPSGHLDAVLENGQRPLQYFLRWYGFSQTFPGCKVYVIDF